MVPAPSLMGGGDGSDALSRISTSAHGATPHPEYDGKFATTANATIRFRAPHTDPPWLEATHSGGSPVVRVGIYAPDAARLWLITNDSGLDADTRPDECSSRRVIAQFDGTTLR